MGTQLITLEYPKNSTDYVEKNGDWDRSDWDQQNYENSHKLLNTLTITCLPGGVCVCAILLSSFTWRTPATRTQLPRGFPLTLFLRFCGSLGWFSVDHAPCSGAAGNGVFRGGGWKCGNPMPQIYHLWFSLPIWSCGNAINLCKSICKWVLYYP